MLNRSVKTKEKENYDLKKENANIKEDLNQANNEFANFRVKVNKEIKDLEKKVKKTEKKEFMNNLKIDSKPAGADFACKHCDAGLETTEKLKSHEIVHHQQNSSTQTEETVVETKFVQCKLESKIKDSDAVKEQKEKLGNYACNDCGNTFNSDLILSEHKRMRHGFGTHSYSSLNQNPVQNLMTLPIGFPLTPFSPWPPYPPHSR